MKIQFKARNIEVKDSFKEYAEKRMARLDKFVDPECEAVITVSGKRNKERVEITLPVNGYLYRGEEETDEKGISLDYAIEKLEKQIKKTKERYSKKGRLSISKLDLEDFNAPAQEADEVKVRYKGYNQTPMSLEDAINRMEALSHNFFVFVNSDTKETNVVYLRKDGNFGLLEPEK